MRLLFSTLLSSVVLTQASCVSTGPIKESDLVSLDRSPGGEYYYEEIFTIDNLSAKNLYDRTMLWVAENYNSANDVIQLRDAENKRIVGKGVYVVPFKIWTTPVRYTIRVDTKNERLKVRIDNFVVVPDEGPEWGLEGAGAHQLEIVNNTGSKASETATRLILALSEKDDDW